MTKSLDKSAIVDYCRVTIVTKAGRLPEISLLHYREKMQRIDVMYAKESLDQIAYRRFMTGFYSCSYHPGEIIDPAELAERYCVSRTPVVQALKQLAHEKIIAVQANGRFFIPVPTEATLRGVCRTRIVFEQEAIGRLNENKDPAVIQSLRQIADSCYREVETVNNLESVKRDMDFHRTLVAASGNSCMQELYETVLNRYISIKYVLRDQYRSQRAGAQRHIDIINAIEAGKGELAKDLLSSHILSAMEMMVQIIHSLSEQE